VGAGDVARGGGDGGDREEESKLHHRRAVEQRVISFVLAKLPEITMPGRPESVGVVFAAG
jgi:hypothetical protein